MRSQKSRAMVREFTDMLAGQLELDLLAEQALHKLSRLTGASAGVLIVESDGNIKVAASHGIRNPEASIGSDHVRLALRTGQRQVVRMSDDVAMDGVLTDFRPREVLVEPVFYKNTPLGVIILASGSGFPEEARLCLDMLKQGLRSMALNNALTHDRLQRLAALDSLTNLYNRRFGMARLKEEYGRAVRAETPLGILMFDIDHFKKVNDTYGYLVGDRRCPWVWQKGPVRLCGKEMSSSDTGGRSSWPPCPALPGKTRAPSGRGFGGWLKKRPFPIRGSTSRSQ